MLSIGGDRIVIVDGFIWPDEETRVKESEMKAAIKPGTGPDVAGFSSEDFTATLLGFRHV